MAKRGAKLRVSPDVIEIGSTIIVVAHIARLSLDRDPVHLDRARLRLLAGFLCLAVAIALSMEAFQILGATFGMLGIALLLLGLVFWPPRQLLVVTSDGRTTVLLPRASPFASDVHTLLRAFLATEPKARGAYEIDAANERISRSATPDTTPGAKPVTLPTTLGAGPRLTSRFSTVQSGSAGVRDVIPTNGEPPTVALGDARPTRQRAELQGPELGAYGGPQSPDLAARQRTPEATPSAFGPGQGTVEAFDRLMSVIAPQYGARFEDLRTWLAPVRTYLLSGQGRQAEIQSRWSAFAREHVPALAHLAEVGPLSARITRALGLAL